MEDNKKNSEERFDSEDQTNESNYDSRSNDDNSDRLKRKRTFRKRIDSDSPYNRETPSYPNNETKDKAYYSSDRDSDYNRDRTPYNRDMRERSSYNNDRPYERRDSRRDDREDRYNRPRRNYNRDDSYNTSRPYENRDRYSRDRHENRDRYDNRSRYDRRERPVDRTDRSDRLDRNDRSAYNRDRYNSRDRYSRDNRYNRDSRDRNESYGNRYNRDDNRGSRYDDRRPSRYDSRDRYDNRRPSRYDRNSSYKKKYSPKRRPSKPRIYKTYDGQLPEDGLIRLNKYISNSGMCSRREADEFITTGVVTVNDQVVKELGVKVNIYDEVKVNDRLVVAERKVYILLNKPKGLVTTLDDPQAKKTVVDLLRHCCKERIYPVGRLDKASTGVLLLTNDGELTTRLTQPKYKKKKIYHVHLDKELSDDDIVEIAKGVELEDGISFADEIGFPDPEDKTRVGIEIHSGKNRIIRRIFQHMGYKVKKLDRVFFAGLTKKALGRGKWRFLTDREVNLLKMNAFGADASVVAQD